ncbi:NGG1p interacting factor NIF3, partial [Candidatus Omnitrophota bacterium]
RPLKIADDHPEGRAWAGFFRVMQLQVNLLEKAGLSRQTAEQLVNERVQEVERSVLPRNHMQAVDAARLLDIPLICVHTPADNHAADFIQGLLNKKKPKRLAGIVDILEQVPEYKEAKKDLFGPRVIIGNLKGPVGKVFVEMTGGTEGPKKAIKKLKACGVRTLVSMHLSEPHFKEVKDAGLNVVIAGHISSDTLGMNLLLDRIEKRSREKLQVINCSGFRRIKR